ncbi:hypothetical protein RAMDARK_0741 [Rickettsia amblyommatis str. Darkwater]|uniref:Uncharacterized protein n=1 Tax=Rickettsia amblyommatis str. Ac/Pa TaxID=1359164 RepID=A0A0F3N1R2_RICAM|nr:hypothetical protein APHACPA_1030 [Rickettsia amblyommatis str. Ac/Pa]KJV95049.1 hypothetical protein RAMDARK_0741 [Rickettsia amblyommatis str. Darkwater]
MKICGFGKKLDNCGVRSTTKIIEYKPANPKDKIPSLSQELVKLLFCN